jgi:hypothetical protein
VISGCRLQLSVVARRKPGVHQVLLGAARNAAKQHILRRAAQAESAASSFRMRFLHYRVQYPLEGTSWLLARSD